MAISLNKTGAYAGSLLAIGACLNFVYEQNAWAADLKEMYQLQRMDTLQAENRTLTRQIMQWSTKPSVTSQERKYIRAITSQLESDKNDVVIKMRSIQMGATNVK